MYSNFAIRGRVVRKSCGSSRVLSTRICASTDRFDLLPAAAFGRLQNGIANVLGFERIAEGRADRLPLLAPKRRKKVGDLMDEGVLVTDLEPGHPPVFHIGLIAVGYMDRAPSPDVTFVAVIKILEPMQV